jgi:hypothetical protein
MEGSMHKIMLISAACAAALLAGCTDEAGAGEGSAKLTFKGERPIRIAERLDCPEREGDLRLISAATNGRACAYRGEDGAEVELRLAAAGDLPPLETELRALIPGSEAPPLPPQPPEPPLPPEPVDGEDGHVRIPGVLDVRSEGDRAYVRLPGMTVEAQGENADVRIGGEDGDTVRVRAHDGGATVRVAEPADDGDIRSTFLATSDKPGPAGWRVAGYQARGQAEGPVVIGVLRAREERRGRLMDDVEDLLDRNVKG